jgi:hypothetical protein
MLRTAGFSWLIAGDVLTTERTDRTTSPALQEDQAANQLTKEECRIQHKPDETADRRPPVPQRAKIHVDLPTGGFPNHENATDRPKPPSTNHTEVCRF